MYTKESLALSGITDSTQQLMFGQSERTIKIPRGWVLEERSKQNCSPSEGDIVQEVLMCLFGIDDKYEWEKLEMDCYQPKNDVSFVFKFKMKD